MISILPNGWIKLHRALINKPIWKLSTPEQKTILITLMCMVNHDEEEWEWKGQKYTCKPGQVITSLPNIKKECGKGISIQNIRTALERFKKLEFLTDESTSQNRLITVLNWELYQSKEEKVTDGLTDGSQTGNRRVTSNEECKNDKNDKELKNITLEIENFRQRYSGEIQKFIDEYFEILRTTRVSGKISNSIILQVYKEMHKYPVVVVECACRTVIANPKLHDKKENYFYGILRNTKATEAEEKLQRAGSLQEGTTKGGKLKIWD